MLKICDNASKWSKSLGQYQGPELFGSRSRGNRGPSRGLEDFEVEIKKNPSSRCPRSEKIFLDLDLDYRGTNFLMFFTEEFRGISRVFGEFRGIFEVFEVEIPLNYLLETNVEIEIDIRASSRSPRSKKFLPRPRNRGRGSKKTLLDPVLSIYSFLRANFTSKSFIGLALQFKLFVHFIGPYATCLKSYGQYFQKRKAH